MRPKSALLVGRARRRTNQFMGAGVLAQVPDLDTSQLITTDQFTLIGMYDHVVDRSVVIVIPLHLGGPRRASHQLS
jgi:hypothetical protein